MGLSRNWIGFLVVSLTLLSTHMEPTKGPLEKENSLPRTPQASSVLADVAVGQK